VSAVHVLVPDSIDDPARPSGGNAYDRRICRGLAALGWSVHEHLVPGPWPRPDGGAIAALSSAVTAIPDADVVLLDGLVACSTPEVLVPAADRLHLVVIVHMPLGDGRAGTEVDLRTREHAVLRAAAAVVTTSSWTRLRLLDLYALRPDRVEVAEPGVDSAELAPGTAAGGELLCVAAVAPHKGHDVLVAALRTLAHLSWRCVCVGALDRDPGFVAGLDRDIRHGGIDDRVLFPGPLTGSDLDRAYATADVLVLASRAETYGMVVTEALARGLPVVASATGGLPEALGSTAGRSRPGLLVPPGDSAALAAALRCWLADQDLRRHLRHAARERRTALPGWSATSGRIASVLAGAAQRPPSR
jgi:glycosyltransferase involved in cell wall biosynthesis